MKLKENKEFWDALFPKTSKKVQDRKTFGLVHGATELDNSTGKTRLKYFASHADTSESTVDIEELQTGRSENDALLKNFVYGYQILLAASTVFVLFLSEIAFRIERLTDGLFSVNNIEIGMASSLAMMVFICAVFIWFNLRVHFNDMNTDWVDAVRGIVSVDMTALIGKRGTGGFEPGAIAKCMLIFRRFIKWRRYMNFFEPLLAVLVAIQVAAIVWLLGFVRIGVSSIEIYLLVFGLAFQVFTYLRVSFLRWYWTKWRDPTVQLCLAFASLDRQLWVAKHPAAPGRSTSGEEVERPQFGTSVDELSRSDMTD